MRLFESFLAAIVVLVVNFSLGTSQRRKVRYVKEDLPYVSCGVCENVVEHFHSVVADMREKAPYNRLSEVEIIAAMDSVCTPHLPNGMWTRRVNIQSTGVGSETVLELVKPGGQALCGTECQTLSKSCQMLFEDDVDRDAVAGLYWKNDLTVSNLQEKICGKSMANRCSGKPKYVPQSYKREDEQFKVMSSEEQKQYDNDMKMAEFNAKNPGARQSIEIPNLSELMAENEDL